MMNAAVYCSRDIDHIPNRYAALLYNLTTDAGTYKSAALTWLEIFKAENSKNKILKGVECSALMEEEVTPTKLKNRLAKKKGVVVCDVFNGTHSVLIFQDGIDNVLIIGKPPVRGELQL